MTSDQIKAVSLKHFAQNGYEGASLSHIADDVGIKKQSIYTHFKGKDELYLQVCRDAFEKELDNVKSFIDKNTTQPVKELLYNFLLNCIDRYDKQDSTKFMIRTAFYPPTHLNAEVMRNVYQYLDKLEELYLPILEKAVGKGEINSTIDAPRATSAFLGVMDGIIVEMLYGGPERLNKRLDASWYLYWRGLTND